MKPNLIARWFGVVAFLLAAMSLSPSSTGAQPLQDSMNTAQKPAEFVPPEFSYFSVFEHYQWYQEEAVTSWPEANTTVGRIGGWRFYAEEALQPESDQQSNVPLQHHQSPVVHDSSKHTGHGGKP